MENGRALRQSFCGSSVHLDPRWRTAAPPLPSVDINRELMVLLRGVKCVALKWRVGGMNCEVWAGLSGENTLPSPDLAKCKQWLISPPLSPVFQLQCRAQLVSHCAGRARPSWCSRWRARGSVAGTGGMTDALNKDVAVYTTPHQVQQRVVYSSQHQQQQVYQIGPPHPQQTNSLVWLYITVRWGSVNVSFHRGEK
ncbi:hypothetical protein E2C01_008552 [Portunus trituberculatus]|uniref:Uncharacterized protein n=1 Tax=Portunus trituberculatus TaxID=210409 RepID=A0A5B7D259_PORTR|nr:hypothetical protein [Portunus trituberculatus]